MATTYQRRRPTTSEMAATTAAAPALSMKLLIDRKAERVLFAEASKDVVDFLFSLLALPVATALKLVGKEAMVGCLGNLYASVDKLGSTSNMLTGAARDALLCPAVMSPAAAASSSTFLRLAPAPPFLQVQGTVTSFTVMDDLTVAPAVAVSPINSISMLSTFAVKDLGDLQETTVHLGYNEGLAILKASLQSKSTVLTDVFLHGNSNNKQAGSSTPVVGASSRSDQDGVVADGPVTLESRSRKPNSRVFGQEWSNDS